MLSQPLQMAYTTAAAGALGGSDLDEDSDAVDTPALLLIKIATKVLVSPRAMWLGHAFTFMYAAMRLAEIDRWSAEAVVTSIDGRPNTTALADFSSACLAVGASVFSLPLVSLRRVTRDDGQLKALGVGSTKISAKAAKSLGRWHVALVGFAALWVYLGLIHCLESVGLLGDEFNEFTIHPGKMALTTRQRVFALVIGLFCAYVWPLAIAWWLSLNEASVLVSYEVIECRKLIDKTSATSADWDALVVPELLKLINETLPTLSEGWADGMLALWAGCWVSALGTFAGFLNNTSATLFLYLTVFLACLPLCMAAGVAGASSDCDAVKAQLNKKRASDLSVENDAKLYVIERLLQNLNKGQGLGFVVAGKVLNKTTLKTIFVAVGSFLGAAVPLILALKPPTIVPGTEACALTAQQVAGIKAAMMTASASCAPFNVTISEALAL